MNKYNDFEQSFVGALEQGLRLRGGESVTLDEIARVSGYAGGRNTDGLINHIKILVEGQRKVEKEAVEPAYKKVTTSISLSCTLEVPVGDMDYAGTADIALSRVTEALDMVGGIGGLQIDDVFEDDE